MVGRELILILSCAVIPEVLQSDNRGEFLGECIQLIRKHFGIIRIVEGKPRKPSTQGSVERGDKPFNDALYEWMEENPEGCWASIGAFLVNSKINQRPSRPKDEKSPYKIYFGKVALHSIHTMDPSLMKVATMEYGVSAATQVMQLLFESNPDIKLSHQDLYEVIRNADGIFDDELVIMKNTDMDKEHKE
jgi:hypothetical protein